MDNKPRLTQLECQIRRTVSRYGMLSNGDKVVVAVSGGADSMALLHCLRRLAPVWSLNLAIAHLNHQLRGDESDQDAAFVREVCAGLGLPFYLEVANVGAKAASARRNLEDIAREIRYEFLRRMAAKTGAQKIALGHTLDDQAETVLMRFLRGSGVEGLSAIYPVVDGLIIRPLLGCTRSQILAYLKSRGIRFREDTSNLDLGYSRNRVRRELIPYLSKHFNPGLAHTLAREAELAREISGFLKSKSQSALEAAAVRDAKGLALAARKILELHPALQRSAVREALRGCRGNLRGVTAGHIEDILTISRPLHSGRRVELPGGGVVLRQFENLLFLREIPAEGLQAVYELPVPGRCVVAEAGLEMVASVEMQPSQSFGAPPGSYRAFLDAAALPATLTIRSRMPGDRYGGPHHRKVKKMLIDAKIPLHLRDRLPVVLAGDTVIWMPGFKPAKSYIARGDSGRCVMIEALRMTNDQ